MIIDFHTHVFPPWLRDRREQYVERDATFGELYRSPRAKMATAEDLVRAMGREDLLEDERFSRGKRRHENADALYEEIAKWTRAHTKHEAMKILADGGVPCSAVLDTRDLYEDPHLQARGFVHSVEHESQGRLPMFGWGPRLEKSDVPMRAAPLLGRHTEEVLRADLGLASEELQSLRDAGALG